MPFQRSTSHGSIKRPYFLSISAGLLFIAFAILLALQPVSTVDAAPPEPTEPEAQPTTWASSRLDKPVLSDDPTQAEKGAIPYWGICMACHGDKGQGLTDEWRSAGFGEDMNCWKSRCHASNHPTPGFEFPRVVPAVIGPNTLRRFTTAMELNNYIKTSMPWWDPGSLSKADAWNLTAYLLRENGSLLPRYDINVQEAATIPVHLKIRSVENERTGQYALAAVLALAIGAIVTVNKIKPKDEDSTPTTGGMRPNFFHHLHPPTIPMPQARWRYTLGAGGLAVFLTLVVGITGILEMFFYIPTPEQAGLSIQIITFLVPFGGLVRGLHFWAAQGLVIVAGIHLLRVIFTGAYNPPRRFNFLLGMVLFVLIFFLDFTGYILRWDDGIHWAMIVGTNLVKAIPRIGAGLYGFVVGGESPGPAMLTRFYAWHIFGLTLAIIIFLAWHIFRVRRDGGISAPDAGQRTDTRRITRYELVQREVLAMLIVSAVLILVASLIPAPLAAPIRDASVPLNPDVRAPWFFLWVQQMLRYGDAFWMGVAIPVGMLVIVSVLPYLLPNLPADQKGRWFPRAGRIAQAVAAVIAVAWLVLTILEIFK